MNEWKKIYILLIHFFFKLVYLIQSYSLSLKLFSIWFFFLSIHLFCIAFVVLLFAFLLALIFSMMNWKKRLVFFRFSVVWLVHIFYSPILFNTRCRQLQQQRRPLIWLETLMYSVRLPLFFPIHLSHHHHHHHHNHQAIFQSFNGVDVFVVVAVDNNDDWIGKKKHALSFYE